MLFLAGMQTTASHPYLLCRDQAVSAYLDGSLEKSLRMPLLALLQKDFFAAEKLGLAREQFTHKKETDAKNHYLRAGHLQCRRKSAKTQKKAMKKTKVKPRPLSKQEAGPRPPLPRVNFIPVEPEPWQKEMQANMRAAYQERQAQKKRETDNPEMEEELSDDDAAYLALPIEQRRIIDLKEKLKALDSQANKDEVAVEEADIVDNDEPPGEEPVHEISRLKPRYWTDELDPNRKRYPNPEEVAKAKQEELDKLYQEVAWKSRESGEAWRRSGSFFW